VIHIPGSGSGPLSKLGPRALHPPHLLCYGPGGASPTNRGAHIRAKLHECTRDNIGGAHIRAHIWPALTHART
jgi:hypothetical protein